MAIEVRVLEPFEWELLRSVRLAALETNPEAFLSSGARETQFSEEAWRSLCPRRAIAFVDGSPVGMVGWSWHEADDFLQLVGLWVHPDHRDGNIAVQLSKVAVDVASSCQCPLRLAVHRDNSRALRFYEKFGFVETGRELMATGDVLAWMECRAS